MRRPLRQYFLVMRAFSGWIFLSILLGIATIGAGIGLLGTSAYLIASAALQPSIADLQVAIVGVRFFGLSRAVFRYLERLVSHSVNLRILGQLRSKFYQNIEPGAPANLEAQKSGDLLERVIGDLETLENFYVRVFAPAIVTMVITLGMSVFVGGYAFTIGLLLGLGLTLNGFIIPAISLWLTGPLTQKIAEHYSRLSSTSVEFMQGLEDLVTNGTEEIWLKRLANENQGLKRSHLKLSTLSGGFNAVHLVVMNLTILAAVVIAIPLVRNGDLSGVSLAVILLLVGASFEATNGMPQAAKTWTASREAARRLFEFPDHFNQEHAVDFPEPIPQTASLKLEKISFHYPGENRSVLENIDLVLNPGQTKAIVGLSGSGKTTLFDLLLRFWEPTAGKMSIGNLQAGGTEPSLWRKYFGVIGQSIYLFNASVRDNLLMSDPAASDSRLLETLQQAGLGNWFSELPQGLDTWVGEHGLRLSAGERQRLAISRILLTNPVFVLLDEPTANLDSQNEIELLKTLRTVFSAKGILLITHRFDLLGEMDEVILLDQGKIVEKGNPRDLGSQEGMFKKMLALQRDMLNYRNTG